MPNPPTSRQLLFQFDVKLKRPLFALVGDIVTQHTADKVADAAIYTCGREARWTNGGDKLSESPDQGFPL